MRTLIPALLALIACSSPATPPPRQPELPAPPVTPDAAAAVEPAQPPAAIESADILARDKVEAEVQVKHVLLAWKELGDAYRGELDPRAAKRTQADAAKLAVELAERLRKEPTAIDALITQHSEDPGSLTGEPYAVKPESPLVGAFKNLALRLAMNEVGIVRTEYGYHVMIRVPPPPPDPLESADILARKAEAGPVTVQHILIGWRGMTGASGGALQRDKATADQLAKHALEKVRGGGDMAKLMKEMSDDPGSKDDGRSYEVTADAPMVEPFKNLSLRLKIGEAGLVKTSFGWHVVKRLPPPAPDPLESADILGRAQVTQRAVVKHILLGWKQVHAADPRAEKRERADLDKLVKATVAKLKKGAKIEPLMAELSEDPGSAVSGTSYEVTPDQPFVARFKSLALRLKVNEVGIVRTEFGMHILQRIE